MEGYFLYLMWLVGLNLVKKLSWHDLCCCQHGCVNVRGILLACVTIGPLMGFSFCGLVFTSLVGGFVFMLIEVWIIPHSTRSGITTGSPTTCTTYKSKVLFLTTTSVITLTSSSLYTFLNPLSNFYPGIKYHISLTFFVFTTFHGIYFQPKPAKLIRVHILSLIILVGIETPTMPKM